jgi:uncharacterized protein
MEPGSALKSPVLLDTGVLVALVNGEDPAHERCVTAWSSVRGPVITVEGVLVEAAHLLRKVRGGAAIFPGLLDSVGAEVASPSPSRYRRAARLMDQHRNVPMDLVDAVLVALAEERRIHQILSLDRRGFSTYRIAGRGHIELLPSGPMTAS